MKALSLLARRSCIATTSSKSWQQYRLISASNAPTLRAMLCSTMLMSQTWTQCLLRVLPEPCKMRCSHCEHLLCQACGESRVGGHLCPRFREHQEEDERLPLAEVARLLQEQQLEEAEEAASTGLQKQMRGIEEQPCQLKEQRQAQLVQSEELIMATYKPCPRCRAPITCFKGHACHHIRPGGGCSVCHHQFCYMCLAPWHTCRCPTYCTDNCGCPSCPTCQPGQACDGCDGDGRCPSCNA